MTPNDYTQLNCGVPSARCVGGGGSIFVPRLRAVVLRFAIETATGSFFIWGY